MENNKFKAFLCSKLGKAVMIILFYGIILALFTLVITNMGGTVGFIIALAFVVFGWQALSMITPRIFLIMPIGGWVIYFVIKVFLSCFVGVFVAPFVIANKIAKAIQNNI